MNRQKHGQPWTPSDEGLLVWALKRGYPLDVTCDLLERGPAAVTSRGVHLGLLAAHGKAYYLTVEPWCTFLEANTLDREPEK